MNTPVIYATNASGSLRVYLRNGDGIEQVSQSAVHNAIDPATLVNMIADLDNVFGWSAPAIDVAPTPVPKKLPAPKTAEPPKGSDLETLKRVAEAYAADGRDGVMQALNISRTKASQLIRTARDFNII